MMIRGQLANHLNTAHQTKKSKRAINCERNLTILRKGNQAGNAYHTLDSLDLHYIP